MIGGGAAVAILAAAELLEVVVSAEALDAGRRDNPAPTEVYGAREIADSGAQDLGGFLDRCANLQVRTLNASPYGSHIAMRGYGENSFGRVQVNLDGESLANLDMEYPDLTRVPLWNLTRVEVIHGPATVLYGDGAVAGVVNLSTDAGDYSNRTAAVARGGSDATFALGFSHRGGDEEARVRYHAAYDYRTSQGWRDRSGYRSHSLMGALAKDFAGGSSLGVRAHYANGFYEMPGPLAMDDWRDRRRAAAAADDFCRQWQYGAGLTAHLRFDDERSLDFDAGYSRRHRSPHWGDYGISDEYDLDSFSFSPRYVDERTLGGFDQRFTAGADVKWERDVQGGDAADGRFTRWRAAGYLYEEFRLRDGLSLVGGARLEQTWNRQVAATRKRRDELTADFELGVVWHPLAALKVFLKGTRFHRSPFCDEMTYTESGELLESERGWSLDLGCDWQVTEELDAALSFYATRTDDEIFYDPYAKDYGGHGVGYNCNSPGWIRRLGAEASLVWRRERTAEAEVRGNFVDARQGSGKYGGNEVPLVPAVRVRAMAGVWIFDELEVKGSVRFVAKERLAGDFAGEHGFLPSSVVFDLGLEYRPRWCEGLRVGFTCDNLLDRAYVDYAQWSDATGASCYPATGRTFMFTIACEW